MTNSIKTNTLRPEYPRPQFVREDWMNLNGEWDFEIDSGVHRTVVFSKPLNDSLRRLRHDLNKRCQKNNRNDNNNSDDDWGIHRSPLFLLMNHALKVDYTERKNC